MDSYAGLEDETGNDELEQLWGNNSNDNAATLTQIQEKFASLDPEMRNTSFGKFISQYVNKEIDFKSGEVVETPEAASIMPGADDEELEQIYADEKEFHNWLDEYAEPQPNDTGEEPEEYEQEFGNIFYQSPGTLEYEYSHDNPYDGQTQNFDTGLQLFQQGQIRETILALEAEVKQNPQNSKAWKLLGQCHTEFDDDQKGIAAFQQAVTIDPTDLQSLVNLGVSYTNEAEKLPAVNCLRAWLESNPKYREVYERESQGFDVTDFNPLAPDLYNRMIDLLVKADYINSGNPDPDIQAVLGVLFNMTEEYEKAIECFRRALDSRPNDYSLWNKLGATIANSNTIIPNEERNAPEVQALINTRNEQSIECYFRALRSRSNYVRALVNVAVSLANSKSYHESARYYLMALSKNPEVERIWYLLGRVFGDMNRNDLVNKTMTRNVDLFRDEFNLETSPITNE